MAGFGVPGFLAPFATAQAAPNDPVLVVLGQLGGNDGLNTVVPLQQFGAYSDLRRPRVPPGDPALALNLTQAQLQATTFDGNPQAPAGTGNYAFHPSMTALRTLYGTGRVAVTLGIGLIPDETDRLSHEVGIFDWNTGKIKAIGQSTLGWLGLALDGATPGRLPAAVSVSGDAPTLLNGNLRSALVIGTPIENFVLVTGAQSDADNGARIAGFAQIQSYLTDTVAGEFARANSASTSGFVGGVQGIATANPAADYPPTMSFLDLQLKQVARLVGSGSGVRAYYVVHGGYDTHAEQNRDHPRLLGEVSSAIANFYGYLKGKGLSSNVTVMTFTDFGRRPGANDTFGTDHGTASVTFLVGDRVRGGIYGMMPNLSQLDADGNPQVQVDFRQHLSDVLRWMGANPAAILGSDYPPLGYFA